MKADGPIARVLVESCTVRDHSPFMGKPRADVSTGGKAIYIIDWKQSCLEVNSPNLAIHPRSLLPVTSLGREPVGDGKMGAVTRSLLDRWSENVGVDIVAQIKTWNMAQSTQGGDAPTPYAFKKTR